MKLFYLALAGALALAQPRSPIPQQLTFTPYHTTGIYEVGETVGWTVTPGPVAPTYSYKWTARRNKDTIESFWGEKLALPAKIPSNPALTTVPTDVPDVEMSMFEIDALGSVWTVLNQIPGSKEPLPMIESEHDNLTPQKGRACPARSREILDTLVKGGAFQPSGAER